MEVVPFCGYPISLASAILKLLITEMPLDCEMLSMLVESDPLDWFSSLVEESSACLRFHSIRVRRLTMIQQATASNIEMHLSPVDSPR